MPFFEKLTAVILAGGLGTRLRSAVGNYPKVLAPVNNRPFLTYIFDQLLCCGFSDVVLCTGHGADQVNAEFGNIYKELSIEYSPETEPLGTGGALRNALPCIKTDHMVIMNGDSYINVDLKAYIEWYFLNRINVSLLLTRVSNVSRYGRVDIDKNGFVKKFVEKGEKSTSGWINSGVYLLNKSLISQTPMGKSFSLEHDFFPKLVGNGLCGFRCKESFIDIGTPDSYGKANQFFKIYEVK